MTSEVIEELDKVGIKVQKLGSRSYEFNIPNITRIRVFDEVDNMNTAEIIAYLFKRTYRFGYYEGERVASDHSWDNGEQMGS